MLSCAHTDLHCSLNLFRFWNVRHCAVPVAYAGPGSAAFAIARVRPLQFDRAGCKGKNRTRAYSTTDDRQVALALQWKEIWHPQSVSKAEASSGFAYWRLYVGPVADIQGQLRS